LKLDGKILIHKNVGKFVGMPMDALIPLAIRFIAFKFSSYIDSMNSLKTPIDNIKKKDQSEDAFWGNPSEHQRGTKMCLGT